jgi:Peptidase family S41/Tricorn protease C1 domain
MFHKTIFIFLAVLLGGSTLAQTPPIRQSLDGLWLTDGYGELIEIQGDNLRTYEVTSVSCLPASQATRVGSAGSSDETAFRDEEDFLRISSGPSADSRWLHHDWSVSNVLLHRTMSRPQPCGQKLADTPLNNYRIFWETYAEQYPFFHLHQIDWRRVDKKFRPQVTATTKPDELFAIFTGMIEPLRDAHTSVTAKTLNKRFEGYRLASGPIQEENVARINEIITSKYVRGSLRDYCKKQIEFGVLRADDGTDSIGYLRINSFAEYSDSTEYLQQLDAFEAALDDIFNSVKLMGLVIDVRVNGGGYDGFGVSIASRLTTREYLAYSKVMRDDIHDPNHRTPPQHVMVDVSQRPGFHGPVVLLIGPDSESGAETFAMALLERQPHVTKVGSNTQGVFSDVLARHLPNGWRFGLPNEIYVTRGGKAFDGIGVPPDIGISVFAAEDLANGRDAALEKALELLSPKVK